MKSLLHSLIAVTACIASPAFAQTSLPLSVDTQGRPTVPVSINGQGPFQMAVDTAAQRMGLSAKIVADLKLQPIEGARAALRGATGVRHLNRYRLDSVLLGAEARNGVVAVELAGGGETVTHTGVFGADVFAGKRLEFDYEHAQLKIAPGGVSAAPPGFASIPASLMHGTFVIVPIKIGGVAALGLVDTGAQHSIANPHLMRALGYSDDDARLSVRQSSGGATNHAAVMRSGGRADLSMGRTAFGQIDIAFADLPVFTPLGLADGPSIILGADVWRKMKAMAIDYERKELQLRP